eukprot:c10410_g1_i1.p2 GENE.c10410_g1_i1~~c10410_g1_i1.p2  ORF type:complete len:183 (-),score=48.55 c10410_g1_i1:1021-1515(-)
MTAILTTGCTLLLLVFLSVTISAETDLCGDGVHMFNDEGCDDGNKVSGDGCDSNCRVESDLWVCYTDARLKSRCIHLDECGDGMQEGNEECDDGNEIDNDACTNHCQVNHVYFLQYTAMSCILAAVGMLVWAGVVFLWAEFAAPLPFRKDVDANLIKDDPKQKQ